MAIQTYLKGKPKKLSKNFGSEEFRCGLGRGCNCTTILIDDLLWQYLQKIRDHFDRKVTITSGYRCPSYNLSAGGAVGSYHTRGMAADFVVEDVPPKVVAAYAESIGILGIGLYEGADGNFVHIDTRTYKSFWYGHAQQSRTTFGGAAACAGYGKTDTSSSSAPVNDQKPAETGVVYIVKSGDTLAKIASKYQGQTYKTIADANGIKAPYMIYPGQKLTIPVKDSTTSSAGQTSQSEYATADYSSSPEFLWKFFVEKIGNAYGVSGLLANLNAESNLIAANLEMSKRTRLRHTSKSYTDAVDNGTYKNFGSDYAGYGLAQWTDSTRKKNLLSFAQSKKASIGNRKMQAEFLMSELESRFTAVLQALKTATSVRQASDVVLLRFECPADTSEAVRQKRASFGDGYYQKFANRNIEDIKELVNQPPYLRSVKATLLNVREAPGTNNPILKQLQKGTACTVLEEKDGWGRISEGGWVCLDYLG